MKLEAFFNPKSIAVIGVSRDTGKVGHVVFKNLISSGFGGRLYPVNPNADEILGYKCYGSVTDIEEDIDLAVVAVPAKLVSRIAEECGSKEVKGMIVISAGFSETGKGGVLLEKELLSKCREYGIRMQGPNCLGLISSRIGVNASFASTKPIPGNISIVSQSGALGSAMLNWANLNDIGFSNFISVGNEADLNTTDFLEALIEQEDTRVVGIYIEGVKEGKRFLEVARRLSKIKPIVALKAGTTEVGIRAVSSHTGSLAGSETAFSVAFKKAGILRVNTMKEFFDLLLAFGDQPIPRGRGVVVITNGGGPGILAADACEKAGLDLPLLDPDLRDSLSKQFPPHASLNNPLDVLGDADESRYGLALEAALSNKAVGSVIVILTPQAMTPSEEVARVVVDAARRSDRPILASFMGFDNDSSTMKTLRAGRIPNYDFPEHAVSVLSKMYEYSLILKSVEEPPVLVNDVDDDAVTNIIAKVRAEDRISLSLDEVFEVASAYGIPVPEARIARDAEEAREEAETIGYPVAVKVASPDILHKTDVGGVFLNAKSHAEVENAYALVLRRARALMPQARISGVFVQKMTPPGKEVIVGSIRDPQFGPLVMFGLGGIYVNFLRDVSYRLTPLTSSEAMEMITETKAYTLLKGVRGEPPSDIGGVLNIITRVSQLMYRFSDFAEMEINPLFVYEEGKGCIAVDIRATLTKPGIEEMGP